MAAQDKRVKFDFEIEFTNGGGMQGQDFRLDISSVDITDQALAAYLVSDMRLLMVGTVRIHNKEILTEAHKRRPIDASPEEPTWVDLSHTIDQHTVTYKGLPAPRIGAYLSREQSRSLYEPGTEFHIGTIEMVTNTGTYLDCPFHRYAHGKDLANIALAAMTDLDGIVIRVPATTTTAIDAPVFHDKELRGRAVLVHTGWAAHWNTERYCDNHPFLTADAAQYLQQCGVKLVGIDAHNIDDTRGTARPVHSILLAAEILIVEHLCQLEQLPDEGFTFTAAPPKWAGVGTFPVRAYAKRT